MSEPKKKYTIEQYYQDKYGDEAELPKRSAMKRLFSWFLRPGRLCKPIAFATLTETMKDGIEWVDMACPVLRARETMNLVDTLKASIEHEKGLIVLYKVPRNSLIDIAHLNLQRKSGEIIRECYFKQIDGMYSVCEVEGEILHLSAMARVKIIKEEINP